MLEKYIPDRSQIVFYSSGPPAMVAAIRKLLNTAGINDGYIRTKEFSGY